jgi:hypothetical protein
LKGLFSSYTTQASEEDSEALSEDRDGAIRRFLAESEIEAQRRNTASEIGSSPQDASMLPVEDLVELLPRLGRNEGLIVGFLAAEVVNYWPGRTGNAVVLPRKYRKHYRRHHPEIRTLEYAIFRTLREPLEAFFYARNPTVVNLWAPMNENAGLWVSVQLPYGDERFAILKSARMQSHTETERQRRAGRSVWKKN